MGAFASPFEVSYSLTKSGKGKDIYRSAKSSGSYTRVSNLPPIGSRRRNVESHLLPVEN